MKLRSLFVALLMVASAAGCSKPPPKTTIQQFMEDQVNPAGDLLFRSVVDISDAKGVRLEAPQTAAQWQAVEDKLTILHDTSDVITAKGIKVAPPGFKSEHPPVESSPEWIQQQVDAHPDDFKQRALRLTRTADVAMQAAQAHDARGLQRALNGVDHACESCHLHYFYPNDKRAWQAAKEDGGVD